MTIKFDDQFGFTKEYWISNHMDFDDWHRAYILFKEVLSLKPTSILEIGAGCGMLEDLLKKKVKNYMTLDVSPVLKPDVVSDLGDYQPKLFRKFDLIVCSQVLEHIEYSEVFNSLSNMNRYLVNNGQVIVTVPHQRLYFMWMIPTNIPHIITIPRWFLRRVKDPYHKWEIGYDTKKKDVEQLFMSTGFSLLKYKRLLLNDYWLLGKK